MKQVTKFTGIALAVVCLAACIKVSTVVKVKPDGSGTVEETLIINKASARQMAAQMEGIQPSGGVFRGDFNLLDKARFRESAANMGEGVTYVSGEKITTDEGEGYRAIYAFSDVNKLRLNTTPADKAPPGLEGAVRVSGDKEAFVTFSFVKGPPAILTVMMPEEMAFERLQLPKVMETLVADDPRAAMMADNMKDVFRGMKVGIYLGVQGEIVRANATYSKGSRITLMEVDFGRLFEDQERLKELSRQRPANIEEAKKLLDDLPGIKVELNPEVKIEFTGVQSMDSTYWLNKGAICYTYGNPKAAITYFKKAIELDPSNASAYFNMGICHGETGQYQEAISCINKALEIHPERASYFYGRGRVHLLLGDKDKALEDFKRAAELGDSDARAYLQDTLLEGQIQTEPQESNTSHLKNADHVQGQGASR